nr:MAG TPA: hypothetical protein [Caudoviricetes sp.]
MHFGNSKTIFVYTFNAQIIHFCIVLIVFFLCVNVHHTHTGFTGYKFDAFCFGYKHIFQFLSGFIFLPLSEACHRLNYGVMLNG